MRIRPELRALWADHREKLALLVHDADEELATREPIEVSYRLAMRLRLTGMDRDTIAGIAATSLVEMAYRERLDRELDAASRNTRKDPARDDRA
jgi:hypothetical protein